MGPLERRVRRMINPVSTYLTEVWCGMGQRRQVPQRVPDQLTRIARDRPRTFFGVPSPGDWVVPDGQRPGWQWLPEYGARPNLHAMPRWARIWYRVPLIDRYAYEWMWWHGGWSVLVPDDSPPPPPAAGVREPRRPTPTPTLMSDALDETPSETAN